MNTITSEMSSFSEDLQNVQPRLEVLAASGDMFCANDANACTRLSNVLAIEDSQGFLQGLDLFFASGNAVIIDDTSVHTGRLQLVVISKRGSQLLLRAFQVLAFRGERPTLVLLLCSFE